MEKKYSIYEAKARLSEIIRQVKQNRSVVITERGHDVALVAPIEQASGFEKRVADLTRRGALVPSPTADPAKIAPIARRPGALKRFLSSRSRY
jgi:prevent-host-death family protein